MDDDGVFNGSTPRTSLQFCFLDDELEHDRELLECIHDMGASYFAFCDEALNAAQRRRTDKHIIFVAVDFEGELFRRTKIVTDQILGPPALMSLYASRTSDSTDLFPILKRPLYSKASHKLKRCVAFFG